MAELKQVNRIIIHCSATREGAKFDVEDINRWHKAKGWAGCGYHIVLPLGGRVQYGRSLNRTGAHTYGKNSDSIGICIIGGLDKDGKPKDTRTQEQIDTLKAVISALKEDYPNATVHGHNEFSNKACPSFDVSKEF
jgi:N-acetylmuramoyl-L-alanine amidase